MPNSDETGGSTPDTSQPRQLIQVNIPLPPKLELKGNLATNWKKFKRMWTNYEIASRLRNENNELRTATLLTCIGPDTLEIYDGLPFESETDKTNIDIVLQKLETFNKRDQEASESIETYVALFVPSRRRVIMESSQMISFEIGSLLESATTVLGRTFFGKASLLLRAAWIFAEQVSAPLNS